MVYPPLNLSTVFWVVGLLLLLAHGIALAFGDRSIRWLRAFPRSKPAGTVLLTVAAAWAFLLAMHMDLGEFSGYRKMILVVIPVTYVLTFKFVPEFLAVRSLGMILLLAAEPLLEAAFLKPGHAKLLLVILAYAWVTAGFFWLGMPYLLRDQIAWATGSKKRWAILAAAGCAYGVALVICPLILRPPA